MYCRSVPFCAGILSIGIGTSGNRIGIGSGMIPNGAYFAHSSATRASIGIAGNGRPLKSCMSITFVRSSPVTVTVPAEPWLPACTSTFVITPSKSGCGWPFKVTISSTRSGGVASDALLPAAIRKIVLSSDLLLNWNLSWKPLAAPSDVCTSTLSSASITTRGAGSGMIGPIISVSWMPLARLAGIDDSRHAFRQRDGQASRRR